MYLFNTLASRLGLQPGRRQCRELKLWPCAAANTKREGKRERTDRAGAPGCKSGCVEKSSIILGGSQFRAEQPRGANRVV